MARLVVRASFAFVSSTFILLGACGDDGNTGSPPTPGGAGGRAGGGSGGAAGVATAAGRAGAAGTSAGAAGTSAGAAGTNAGAAGTSAGAAGNGGAAGTSGGAAGAAGSAECAVPADCGVPATKPVKCAEGLCVAGSCVYRAKDADADGHTAASCTAVDPSVVIKLGDDCDDADPSIHPGAWDGPADGTKASACYDGVDQDCSGTADDGKTAGGQTCACTPGDVAPCTDTPDGKPITFPVLANGLPVGECKRGSRICLANGTFGPCVGAVGPAAESCNGKDDNCDGTKDEAGATNERFFLWDADNDLHAAKGYKPVLGCNGPGTPPPECANCVFQADAWKPNIPADDCDDQNQSVFPGATEICDGTDNDCDGQTDEGNVAPAVWAKDADGDNHGDKDVPTFEGCAPPGPLYRANIPNDDCNDADTTVHPGATERCNGRDDTCGGKTDEATFEIGTPCDVRGLAVGACKGGGKWDCAANGDRTCVSLDPAIGVVGVFKGTVSQDHRAPNGSSDWDCDGDAYCDGASSANLPAKYTHSSIIDCPSVAEAERAKCVAFKFPDLCSFATKPFLCLLPAAGVGISGIQCVANGSGGCKVGPDGSKGLRGIGTLSCE